MFNSGRADIRPALTAGIASSTCRLVEVKKPATVFGRGLHNLLRREVKREPID